MEMWILTYLNNSVPTHLQNFSSVVKHVVYWVAMEMELLYTWQAADKLHLRNLRYLIFSHVQILQGKELW